MNLPAFPPATWRLLLEPAPREGALNMAIDEAMLRSVAAGEAPPTLRLYAWTPAVSLGRGQPYADVDADALRARGYGLVRRPTGGTAVLHTDEVSYSVAVPDDEPRLGHNVVESYRGISAALLHALARLGLDGAVARRHVEGRAVHRATRSPVCFATPADYEITVGERKLVGSAQMRIKGGIMQHGTLPLAGEIAALCDLLSARPDPGEIRARTLTLHEALGGAVPRTKIVGALLEGFTEVLNLTLLPGTFLPQERVRMEHLLVSKYQTEEWTKRL